MSRFVEIRSYHLKPETRSAFHRLVIEQALPMLQRWQTDVVGFGPSRSHPGAHRQRCHRGHGAG